MPTIEAADLSIAYDELGDGGAPAALLIHGWPDDASAWAEVAPAVAASGRRVIVPTLRGFGDTRFLGADAPRTGTPPCPSPSRGGDALLASLRLVPPPSMGEVRWG